MLARRRPRLPFKPPWTRSKSQSSASGAPKNSRDDAEEWRSFLPTAEKLIEAYSAYYGRRRHPVALAKWRELEEEGWEPDRRPRSDSRWWEAEQRRGRPVKDPTSQLARADGALALRPIDKGKDVERRWTSPWGARRRLHGTAMPLREAAVQRTPTASSAADADPMAASATGSTTADADEDFVEAGPPMLRPGDLVQFTFNGQSHYGIFVKQYTNTVLMVTDRAEGDLASADEISFVVGGVVPPAVAARASQGLVLAGGTLATPGINDPDFADAARARRDCSRALTQAEIKRDAATGELVKAGWRHLYQRLASAGRRSVTVEEAVETLLGVEKVDSWTEWAMTCLLLTDAEHYLWSAPARSQNVFRLHPPAALANVEQLRAWIRDDAPALRSFVKRARTLILLHRDEAKPPEGERTPWSHWTRTDRVILQAFLFSVNLSRRIQSRPVEVLTSRVLRLTGCYDETSRSGWPPMPLDRHGTILFLREVGVLPPWQLPELFSYETDLAERYRTEHPSTGKPLRRSPGSGDVDSLDAKRHDFGALPVYVIDDVDAEELDDGLSIELCDDESAWVHVHVADPTASLSPQDPIAQVAQSRLTTVYSVGKLLPMFPAEFLRQTRASLFEGESTSQRCLTFSARINRASGDVLESTIRVGVVQNVRRLTYAAVRDVLEPAGSGEASSYMFCGPEPDGGWPVQTTRPRTDLPERVVRDLESLEVYRHALMRSRVRAGAIGWFLPSPAFALHSRPALSTGSLDRPKHFRDVPSVSLKLPPVWDPTNRARWSASGQQPLVAEFMILAGRVAASFAQERDLPMPYRGQLPPVVDDSVLEAIRRSIDVSDRRSQGVCDFVEIMRKRVTFDVGRHSVVPMPHFPLGIADGYVRATSPLRRYSDLAVHWQIKTSLGSSTPAISKSEMAKLVARLDGPGKTMAQLEKKVEGAWTAFVIKHNLARLRDDPSSVDPATAATLTNLVAITLQDPAWNAGSNTWTFRTYIPALGVRASLVLKRPEPWFADFAAWKTRGLGGGTAAAGKGEGADAYEADLAQSGVEALAGISVPVSIVRVNPEDHVIVEVDRARMHELRMLP